MLANFNFYPIAYLAFHVAIGIRDISSLQLMEGISNIILNLHNELFHNNTQPKANA